MGLIKKREEIGRVSFHSGSVTVLAYAYYTENGVFGGCVCCSKDERFSPGQWVSWGVDENQVNKIIERVEPRVRDIKSYESFHSTLGTF